MLRALLILAAVLLLAAPAAAAPPLKLIDRGPAGYDLRSDGSRWIGWSTYVPGFGVPRGSAEFYDLRTGARLARQTRDYCYFASLSPDDEVLWTCVSPTGEAAIIDRGGNETVLTAPAGLGAETARYASLGRAWLGVRHSGRNYSFESFVNRATGEQVRPSRRDRGVVYDPDSPALRRRLCRGMSRPLVAVLDYPVQLGPGPLAISGRVAAATTYTNTRDGPNGRVVLQRCGHPQRVIQRCTQPSYCSQPVIGARVIAWTRTRRQRTTLYVRSVRTGLTRSLPFAGQPPLLVADRLFAAADGRLVEIGY